jgi:hypothetical protein
MTLTATKTLSQLLTDAGSRWAPMARGEETWEDSRNEAVRDLIERYEDDPEALLNFDTSDWVNLAECYNSDLLRRYNDQEDDIKSLFNDYCENIGATSTLEALEGETIEDPEDMMAAMVNRAMTWAAIEILREIYPDR